MVISGEGWDNTFFPDMVSLSDETTHTPIEAFVDTDMLNNGVSVENALPNCERRDSECPTKIAALAELVTTPSTTTQRQ